jgi:dolichol kinase
MKPSEAPPAWCRPALHAGTGLGALLLGVLPHPWAIVGGVLGVLAGWVVFRFTIERWLRRPGEPFFGGLRTYPLAVLLLVIFLPAAEAAAAWAILAFGDVAAALVGRRVRAPALFGHAKATWSGTLAYFLVGSVAAFAMASAVGWLGRTVGTVDVGPVPSAARCVLAALAAAISDLVPIPPDDNLPAAGAAGVVLGVTRAL